MLIVMCSMRKPFVIAATMALCLLAFACSCQNATVHKPYTTPYIGGPPPTNLPTFGSPGTNSIRVTVFGDVVRPGVYYLQVGAVVRDAIAEAQGLDSSKHRAWWSYMSGLGRLNADGSPKVVRKFNDARRQEDEKIPLQGGDWIHIGHESY
jgi:hypothetical protein